MHIICCFLFQFSRIKFSPSILIRWEKVKSSSVKPFISLQFVSRVKTESNESSEKVSSPIYVNEKNYPNYSNGEQERRP